MPKRVPTDSNAKVVELAETTRDKAKGQLKEAIKDMTIETWSPKLVNGRWRAVETGKRHLEGDRGWFTEQAAKSIIDRNLVGDQRDVYYTIRGQFGTKTISVGGKKYAIKSEKIYNLFTNDIMEFVQFLSHTPQQSLGIRPGPRGFIFGQDGTAYVPRKGITYRLDGSPILYFDLADDETQFESRARKIIHFEKASGFEGLTSGDISTMLETIFSTSQGQLTEASHKFLAKREEDGMKVYSVHDADAYGLQMMMLYGLASKNNAYMPTSFYAKHVTPLGLLPSIAQTMNLPPEDAAPRSLDLAATNLTDMVKARPEFSQDLATIIQNKEQWEFQSLNGVHEMAPQTYLAESLRARGDEIKYVPTAAEIKKTITDLIREEVESFIKNQITSYVNNWFRTLIEPEVTKKLTKVLDGDVQEFIGMMEEELPKLDKISQEDYREAVKLKLVKNPAQYYDRAIKQVVSDILTQNFDINADIKHDIQIKSGDAEKGLDIGKPEVPEKPLTKDDIVASIEKKMIRSDKSREQVVQRIRTAVEARFGKPSLEW